MTVDDRSAAITSFISYIILAPIARATVSAFGGLSETSMHAWLRGHGF
jgi:hypothetical protein